MLLSPGAALTSVQSPANPSQSKAATPRAAHTCHLWRYTRLIGQNSAILRRTAHIRTVGTRSFAPESLKSSVWAQCSAGCQSQ